MASYTTLSTVPTVQVLSAQAIIDCVMVGIETRPSHVRAQLTMPADAFAVNAGDNLLTPFRNVIEQVMGSGKVVAARGVQQLDASGLLEDTIVWTVGYTPPGAPTGPLTVDVQTVIPTPVNSTTLLVNYLHASEAAVDAAYANLSKSPGPEIPVE